MSTSDLRPYLTGLNMVLLCKLSVSLFESLSMLMTSPVELPPCEIILLLALFSMKNSSFWLWAFSLLDDFLLSLFALSLSPAKVSFEKFLNDYCDFSIEISTSLFYSAGVYFSSYWLSLYGFSYITSFRECFLLRLILVTYWS